MSNGTIELPAVTVSGVAPPVDQSTSAGMAGAAAAGGSNPLSWLGGNTLSGLLVFHTTFVILYADNSTADTDVKPGAFRDISSMFPAAKLINFRYEDHISFQADELEIIFPDPNDIIIQHKLVKGGWLKVQIHQWNADYPGSHTMADPGSFQIDQIKQTGPPTQSVLMASSVPISTTIKLTLKNEARFGILDLHQLADTVANENGLGNAVWDIKKLKGNEYISHVEQYQESDFAMLSRELRSRGLSMKFKDVNGHQRLIVFDEQEYEDKPPVFTIDFGNKSLFSQILGSGRTKGITHWELTTQSQDIYSLATISFLDPNTSQRVIGKAVAGDGSGEGTKEELHEYGGTPTQKPDQAGETIAQGDGD